MRRFPNNPFPGMNPWLEGYWGDIHVSLTTYARDTIQSELPVGLKACIEEYLAVEEPFGTSIPGGRRISPDITVVETRSGRMESGATTSVVEEEEPIYFRRMEPQTLRYIQIVDLKAHRRVVTAIEFLSPANKTETGRKQYIRKQTELIEANVNLVEIDLLRQGQWVIAASEAEYPATCKAPYRICVTRAVAGSDGEAYQASYAFPLPRIRIPLRAEDEDIRLPLQPLLNQAFENGRYDQELDYDISPDYPLGEVDGPQVLKFLSSS